MGNEITINIIERTPDGEKSVNPNGSPSSLQIKPDKKVGTLKRNIRDLYGIPVDQQVLYHNGSILLDTTLVSVIGNNGTVYLRRPTVIEIYYYNNTLSGTTKMQHLIDLTDTIERVKQRIITTDNPAAYTVTFQQTPTEASRKLEPENTLTVGNAGIKEFGILHLLRNVPGG